MTSMSSQTPMSPLSNFLLIDAGNSRVKFGCHADGEWLQRDTLQLDAPANLPADFEPERIVIANVAGEHVAQTLEATLDPWRDRIEWLRGSPERCGLHCDYEDPLRLGADRWAAAIGAWNLLRTACLVVCAGTATTVDVVTGDGHFSGGCILPGLELMIDSLARGTAGLPRAEGRFALPPRNTHDAITTGCLQAQVGAIDRMRTLLPAAAPVLLAGGNGGLLAPYLEGDVREMPWLVLEGLLAVAQRGTGTGTQA